MVARLLQWTTSMAHSVPQIMNCVLEVMFLRLFLLTFTLMMTTTAEKPVTNEVTTIADKLELREFQHLTLTCSALAVGLPYYLQDISKLTLQRYIGASPEIIATYDPEAELPSNKQIFQVPHGRNWTVTWTRGVRGEDPLGLNWTAAWREVPQNEVGARKRSIEVIINNAQCDEAALYECIVYYRDGSGVIQEKRGQQRLKAKAAITDLHISVFPFSESYDFTKGDTVVLTCTVNGPPDLLLEWQNGLSGSGIYLPHYEPKVSEPVSLGDHCNQMRHKSVLTPKIEWDGGMQFRCVAGYSMEPFQELFTYVIISGFFSSVTARPDSDDSYTTTAVQSSTTNKSLFTKPRVIVGVFGTLIIAAGILAVYFIRKSHIRKAYYQKLRNDMHANDLTGQPSGADFNTEDTPSEYQTQTSNSYESIPSLNDQTQLGAGLQMDINHCVVLPRTRLPSPEAGSVVSHLSEEQVTSTSTSTSGIELPSQEAGSVISHLSEEQGITESPYPDFEWKTSVASSCHYLYPIDTDSVLSTSDRFHEDVQPIAVSSPDVEAQSFRFSEATGTSGSCLNFDNPQSPQVTSTSTSTSTSDIEQNVTPEYFELEKQSSRL